MSVEWPSAWDQGAWSAVLAGCAFAASVGAAFLAGGAWRAARQQRSNLQRARLLAALERCRALVTVAQLEMQGDRTAEDLSHAVADWGAVSGEVRGHLLGDDIVHEDQRERVRKALDAVSRERSLLLVWLDAGAVPDTEPMRHALREVERLMNELRITIERGADR